MFTVPVAELTREIAQETGCPCVRLEGPISVRDNSVVYRARMGGGVRPDAAVKCCRQPDTGGCDAVLARRQFDALGRVDAAFRQRDHRFRAPAPLFFSARFGAYGMAWIDGESLTARMAREGGLESLAPAFERVGAWMAAFHCAGRAQAGTPDIAGKIAHLAAMQRQPVAHPLFQRSLRLLADCRAVEATMLLQISWLHGDCKTDNFLLARDATYGIDIGLAHQNAIEHDLAQFLNNVDLLALRWRFRHLRADATALNDAFMRGYRANGPAVSQSFLHWVRLWSALTFWHTSIAERRPAWPARWLLNRMFSTLVRGLVAAQGQVELVSARP